MIWRCYKQHITPTFEEGGLFELGLAPDVESGVARRYLAEAVVFGDVEHLGHWYSRVVDLGVHGVHVTSLADRLHCLWRQGAAQEWRRYCRNTPRQVGPVVQHQQGRPDCRRHRCQLHCHRPVPSHGCISGQQTVC